MDSPNRSLHSFPLRHKLSRNNLKAEPKYAPVLEGWEDTWCRTPPLEYKPIPNYEGPYGGKDISGSKLQYFLAKGWS